MRVSLEEFEELVSRALDALPAELADLMDNVAVVVEEEPSVEDLGYRQFTRKDFGVPTQSGRKRHPGSRHADTDQQDR